MATTYEDLLLSDLLRDDRLQDVERRLKQAVLHHVFSIILAVGNGERYPFDDFHANRAAGLMALLQAIAMVKDERDAVTRESAG